jgi:hypothetical protein
MIITVPKEPSMTPDPEPTVTYTLREVLDKIQHELQELREVMSGRLSAAEMLANQAHSLAKANRQEIEKLGVRTDSLEATRDNVTGGELRSKAFFGKLAAISAIFGAVAGMAFGVVNYFI